MENIIGESFDGASNMRGEFAVVHKLIIDVSPNSVYTWCYAHVLNRATNMVENIMAVKNLISSLQSTATFFFRFMQTSGCLEQGNDW